MAPTIEQDEAQSLADAVGRAMYARDHNSHALGIQLEEIRPGYASMQLKVRREMTNGHDTCHGGIIFTIAATLAALMMAALAGGAAAQTKPPTAREMALLCWQEFGELVPARIATVLVPFGSLEPHGVIPNGTDSLAPEAMARDIAARVDALIAPTLNYGVTEAMKAYPGAVSIPGEAYAPFAEAVLDNLAANGFKNIIVLNGHGGNTTVLNAAATKVANARRVRILVINWWTLADDITRAVFKENGGHAGNDQALAEQCDAYMTSLKEGDFNGNL